MKKCLVLIKNNKAFSLLFFFLWVGMNPLYAQHFEASGGAAYKSFLGQARNHYSPALGFEFSALKQDFIPHSSDVMNLGVNIGVYSFVGKSAPDLNFLSSENQSFNQQLVEMKLAYRYDYYYSDMFSFFYGADLGFQFVSLSSNLPISGTDSPSTKLYTTAVLAPNGGVNYEINDYIVVYYKLEYALALYMGKPPVWGGHSSNWSNLLTNSAGLRFRFY